jgi:hypothetical protein
MSDNPLLKYLKNNPVRKTAVEAKVSTATITRLLDPQPAGKKSEWLVGKEIQEWSIRKKRGFIQSVIKLCIYAKVDEIETLECYELGSSREEIEKLSSDIKTEIEEASSKKTLHQVKIGICAWEPFSESNIDIENTWAAKYCRRLLKSVEPTTSIEYFKVDKLDEGIAQLKEKERKGNNHLDMIFGLYETPSRIYEGLDFIPLPGLEIEIGCICPNIKTENWSDFFNLLQTEKENIRPLVIENDIGFGFITGGCALDLSKEQLLSFEDDLLNEFLSKNYQYFNDESPFFYPLIVEKGTAVKVLEKLRYELKTSEFLTETGKEKLKEVIQFGLLKSEGAPSYRVGIAIGHQCKKINASVISYCQRHELFKNTLRLTAIEYMNLFCRDLSVCGKALKLSHPASDFPLHYWNRLIHQLESVSKEHIHSNYASNFMDAREHYITKYKKDNTYE